MKQQNHYFYPQATRLQEHTLSKNKSINRKIEPEVK